jgi:protease-4
MLSGDKREEEISAEERQMVQKMVNDTFARFKEVVGEGRTAANKANAEEKEEEDRGRKLASNWADYADGRILSGKDAYELGFVDELGNFNTAVDRASLIAGLDNPQVIEMHPVFDLSNLLHLFGETKARSFKVDLGIERPRLKSGFMYFIWPMGIP